MMDTILHDAPPAEDREEETEVIEDGKHVDLGDPVEKPTSENISARPLTLRNVFQHPDAHPAVLDLILLARAGFDALTWSSETVEIWIHREFKQVPSHLALSKLNACRTLHLVDSFWERWEVFLPCVMAFNDSLPDFDNIVTPTVGQIANAVLIAKSLRDDMEFNLEVRTFIEQVCLFDGVLSPPDPLQWVTLDLQEYGLDSKQLRNVVEGKESAKDPKMAEQRRRTALVTDYVATYTKRFEDQVHLVKGSHK